MSRLIIVSNRLPVTLNRQAGELHYHPSAGGLATGLDSLSDDLPKVWVGWPGQEVTDPAEQAMVQRKLAGDNLVPVFLSAEEIQLYYEGFSNKTIWPHFHYFTQYTTYREDFWQTYREVNRKFAAALATIIQPDDLIWVHDYQLMLLPRMIRKEFPQAAIGFFLHIPFPSYEIFRILPWRRELLKGILGADLIGFHTFGYMRHFLSAAYRIGGYEHHFGKITVGLRQVSVDVFPMGIDYEKYAHPEVNLFAVDDSFKIQQLSGRGRKLILSIDRLDYTKGIPQRIRAFGHFLARYPQYRGKVSLILIVVPSRASVDQYQELKQQVDTLVGETNSAYGAFDWTPIQYLYRSLSIPELTTLYRVADLAMITPLRDGMNLIAKEFVASKEAVGSGVLILSEMAGAADELHEALLVNPQDVQGMAHAIFQGLEMNVKDQRWRLETMQERLRKFTVRYWANTYLNELKRLMEIRHKRKIRQLEDLAREELLTAYHRGGQRLIMLDYDGTLMAFHPDPQAVQPDTELLELLRTLHAQPGNRLVINSGRDQGTLDAWLGELGIELAAEHGAWMKKNGRWQRHPGLTTGWKKEIRPVLENIVERTPGSFIEEKDFSLAWHYRRIDRDLGEKRVREFRDVLRYLTANLDLQLLEGSKVVEIKNAGVSKGKVTQNWLQDTTWDFILAIGDDHTDEDIFEALPATAFSIKVGQDQSLARFHLRGVAEVRALLRELTVHNGEGKS